VPAVQDDRPRAIAMPLPGRTAMRRSTEGLFPAAQLRRPPRFKAIMGRILNPGQVDRQVG
jgi:hypothetical protein